MNQQTRNGTVGRLLQLCFGIALLCFGAGVSRAAVTVGSTAPNFAIKNHKTGQTLRLYDYAGSVILLDFWAYWCGPCRTAAADMEPYIVQYYRTNGGNKYGVPVTVISISVDPSDPAAVNSFIQTYHLELVGDDTTGSAYGAYGDGYIPYMVVVNGMTNSTNYKAWQVLHSTSGYSRTSIKTQIDSVQSLAPDCVLTSPGSGAQLTSPNVTFSADVNSRGKIIKKVEFYGDGALLGFKTNSPYTLVWSNAPAGNRTALARAIYGASSWADSASVSFSVGSPSRPAVSACIEGNNLRLDWNGGPGVFLVQVSSDLAAPTWQALGGSTTNLSAVIPRTNAAAFFRVLRQ